MQAQMATGAYEEHVENAGGETCSKKSARPWSCGGATVISLAERPSPTMKIETEPQVILEDNSFRLLYHPASKIVHHELRMPVQGERFRGILEQGLELFKKHGARRWLSDDRGNTALPPEDTEWAVTDWSPRVIAAGWKYWAVLMPQKSGGQVNMREFIKAYATKGVTVSAFTAPEAALKWLTTC
jgi:hypothetical protein